MPSGFGKGKLRMGRKHTEETKRKLERKRKIKETVQARLPDLKVTLYTADALGMLLWALRE